MSVILWGKSSGEHRSVFGSAKTEGSLQAQPAKTAPKSACEWPHSCALGPGLRLVPPARHVEGRREMLPSLQSFSNPRERQLRGENQWVTGNELQVGSLHVCPSTKETAARAERAEGLGPTSTTSTTSPSCTHRGSSACHCPSSLTSEPVRQQEKRLFVGWRSEKHCQHFRRPKLTDGFLGTFKHPSDCFSNTDLWLCKEINRHIYNNRLYEK